MRARAHTRCLPPLRVPYQALYRFNYSPLLLLPGSLARITHREPACFYKAAVKRGESRYGRSWGLFRRRKILHCSVYSALWLGGLRCQCRRQTNGPLTARCPCVMVLGKKKKNFMPGMPDYQSSPACGPGKQVLSQNSVRDGSALFGWGGWDKGCNLAQKLQKKVPEMCYKKSF